VVLGVLLLACDGPTGTVEVPAGPSQPQLARLDAAVAEVNATRAAALAAPVTVTDAATALDGADEACLTGQRDLAAEARSSARAAVAPVAGGIAALPGQIDAYRTALDELATAAGSLDGPQQAALAQAATAGAAEAAELIGFGAAAARIWPSYAALDDVQSAWLDRATAGWFRDQREAANAYLVLRKPVVPALEQARGQLARADADRRPATDRMRGALAAADRALAGLRAPAG
jgi:hypothetical protein